MATNTNVPIASYTVTGSATSSVTFSSIPQTYTDLVLIINAFQTGGTVNQGQFMVGNGSITTGTTDYSWTVLAGNGSSAVSARNANAASGNTDYFAAPGLSSADQQIVKMEFINYSNTTTRKTIISRSSKASNGTDAIVNTWKQTSAINTIQFTVPGGTFAVGSTFTLYGIASSDIPAYATGGYVSSDATYWYHAFPMSGTFTPKQALTADILVVAGGGAGGFNTSPNGGGGGAGGLLTFTSQSLASGTGYTCTVGAGGAYKSNGSNSQFAALTATVGGGKGTTVNDAANAWLAAGNGGSGGGGGAGSTAGGTGTSGQGYAGGTANGSYGAGGGGAGALGSDATGSIGGAGGVGVTSALLTAMGAATGYGQLSSGSYYFAGGGAGAGGSIAGGLGGGGTGSNNSLAGATSGAIATGGGGGGGGQIGGGYTQTTLGGSGLIIVRYAK